MNTRRSFVRSMLGAAAVALPFAALTRHAGAQDAYVIAEWDDSDLVATTIQDDEGWTMDTFPVPGDPIMDTERLHVTVGGPDQGLVTVDSGLGVMEHPHFPGAIIVPFSSFDNAIDSLRITIRELERVRDDISTYSVDHSDMLN